MRAAAFLAAMFALLFARSQYRASEFQNRFDGEAGKAVQRASDLSTDWGSWPRLKAALPAEVSEYNKGWSPVLVPAYREWGFENRVTVVAMGAVVSMVLAAFFLVARSAIPAVKWPVFLVAASACILCVCERRYKWHTVAYLSALGVYFYYVPELVGSARKWVWRTLGLLLLAVGSFLYFGAALYAFPWAVVEACRSKTRGTRVAVLWCFWAFVLIMGQSIRHSSVWSHEIRYAATLAGNTFTRQGLLSRWGDVRALCHWISPACLIFFGVGVAASVKRRNRFCVLNLSLFAAIFALELAIRGFINPDHFNLAMVPFLGILLTGLDVVTRCTPMWAVLAICIAFAFMEMEFYPVAAATVPYP